MTTIFKILAISSFVLGIMMTVGRAINALMPWEYFGYFFSLIRLSLSSIDFFFDTTTLLELVGLSFFIEGSIAVVKPVYSIIRSAGWNK
jgi:hypothetical protein